jgi:PTS system mannose-specific IIC component
MDIVLLAFIASVICLDITSFGQLMISRPIVCAPVFGYLCGDIKTGLWVGMMIELLWVSFIPMGAAIPHDNMSIAVLATVWGLRSFPDQKGAIMLALIFSVIVGILFRRFDIWMRYFNVRVMHWVEQGVADGKEKRIDYGIYIGLLLFWLKGFLFYLAFLYPGQLLIMKLYPLLNAKIIEGLELSWRLMPLAGMGILLVKFYNGNLYYTRIKR